MLIRGPEASLQITKADREDLRILCSLEMPFREDLKIQREQHSSLVMDPSRPTCVGFRWDTPPDAWAEVAEERSDLLSVSRSGGIRFSFASNLKSTSEVDAFFPPNESAYLTTGEIDLQTRTLWFPLPMGQSIHKLDRPLNFDGRSLVNIVADWFYERERQPPLPFDVDYNVSCYDEQGVYINCYSKTTDTFDCVEIPAELLRDPIRNGSIYLEHGFNPWNQDQKSAIVAHLEGELVRLTHFFQRDASSSTCGVSTAS